LQERQPRLDPKRLVFIDETSVATTIARLYGWAPQGERLVQKLPHGNWKTITFIAALRHDRVTAPFVLEGPMTGEMFKAYTEQFLAPTLKRGDIVFMDNVRDHCARHEEPRPAVRPQARPRSADQVPGGIRRTGSRAL
jgi:hypothetical protein